MKRMMLIGVSVAGLCVHAAAQGFYFDAGLGVGKSWTGANGTPAAFKAAHDGVTDITVDIGLKIGFGPFGRAPLYLVAEFAGLGQRLEGRTPLSGGWDFVQFNTYLVGPGLVFYPARLLQLAASAGYSVTSHQSSSSQALPQSTGGFAGAASAAFDFGKANHGFLLGARGFYAKNPLDSGGEDEVTRALSLFVKYAYRHKNARAGGNAPPERAADKKAAASDKGFFLMPAGVLYARERISGDPRWKRDGASVTAGLGYDFGRVVFQFSAEYGAYAYVEAEYWTRPGCAATIAGRFSGALKGSLGVKLIDGAVFDLIVPLGAAYHISEYAIEEENPADVRKFSYRYLTVESGLTPSLRCSRGIYLLMPLSIGYPVHKEARVTNYADNGFEPLGWSAGLVLKYLF